MEKFTKNHYVMFVFTLMGLAFSGYLSGVKFFSDTCAFGTACPMFLGYPACYTGFIVYAIIAIVSIISFFKKELTRAMIVTITGVSFFGVLFSGKLTLMEMSVLFSDGFIPFIKSLPLCSIGLIVYIIIFILSLIIGKDCTDPCCGYCKSNLKEKGDKEEMNSTLESSDKNKIESSQEGHISLIEEKMFDEPVEENKDDDKPLII